MKTLIIFCSLLQLWIQRRVPGAAGERIVPDVCLRREAEREDWSQPCLWDILVKPMFLGHSRGVGLQGMWTQPGPAGANGRKEMLVWLQEAVLATRPARLLLHHHLFHWTVSKGNQMSELLEWFCKSVLSLCTKITACSRASTAPLHTAYFWFGSCLRTLFAAHVKTDSTPMGAMTLAILSFFLSKLITSF